MSTAAASKCTSSDTWNCKYCRKTETCDALKDPRNFAPEPARGKPNRIANITPHYTHAEHARACRIAAENKQPLVRHVQVNYGAAVVCGVILDAFDIDDKEMWLVDLTGPVYGRMTFPVTRVRVCSGVDGKCTCKKNDR